MANTPRVQTGFFEDTTGRLITQDYQAPDYAASIALTTTAQLTTVNLSLTGAVTLTCDVTDSKIGDVLNVLVATDSSSRTVTFSTGFAGLATLTVSGNSTGAASFTFNGTSWQSTASGTLGVNSVQTPAYASTIAYTPTSHSNRLIPAQLTGACTINATVTSLVAGDTVVCAFSADGTNRVVTFGTNFKTSGTLTVSANKWAAISFVFDGTYLVATGREVSA